mmetsp:Transcript_44459/g.73584  ORF Transcript_44459/g.73584 Transcript_44459/m.73584 type:complete len:158 (-) Transcript_44459:23-496(-)
MQGQPPPQPPSSSSRQAHNRDREVIDLIDANDGGDSMQLQFASTQSAKRQMQITNNDDASDYLTSFLDCTVSSKSAASLTQTQPCLHGGISGRHERQKQSVPQNNGAEMHRKRKAPHDHYAEHPHSNATKRSRYNDNDVVLNTTLRKKPKRPWNDSP